MDREWTCSVGEKDTAAVGSEAGAGGRATVGKRALGEHDVELCLGIQLGMGRCKTDGRFQGLMKIKYDQCENCYTEHYSSTSLR